MQHVWRRMKFRPWDELSDDEKNSIMNHPDTKFLEKADRESYWWRPRAGPSVEWICIDPSPAAPL